MTPLSSFADIFNSSVFTSDGYFATLVGWSGGFVATLVVLLTFVLFDIVVSFSKFSYVFMSRF